MKVTFSLPNCWVSYLPCSNSTLKERNITDLSHLQPWICFERCSCIWNIMWFALCTLLILFSLVTHFILRQCRLRRGELRYGGKRPSRIATTRARNMRGGCTEQFWLECLPASSVDARPVFEAIEVASFRCKRIWFSISKFHKHSKSAKLKDQQREIGLQGRVGGVNTCTCHQGSKFLDTHTQPLGDRKDCQVTQGLLDVVSALFSNPPFSRLCQRQFVNRL